MRQGVDRGVIIGVGLLTALMVGTAATAYLNTRDLRDTADRVAASRDTGDAIHAVRFDAARVQADLRAYLLTGFPEALGPYESSVARLRAGAAALADRTAADPAQGPLAATARGEIEAGLAASDGVAKLRAGPGGPVAAAGVRSFVGPALETLARMDEAERARRADGETAARDAYRAAVAYGLAAAGLGLAAGALIVGALVRSVRTCARDARRLAEHQELLSATLSGIGDAVIATDAAGAVTFLNPVAERLTGWSQAEAAGAPLETVFAIVNETTREPVPNPAVRALHEGVIVGLANHTVLRAKDGSERPIDDSAAPIRAGGAVVGAVLVFRDITATKAAEVALAAALAETGRQKRLYETVLSATPDFVYVFSLDHRVLYANDSLIAMWGRGRDGAIGKTFLEIGYPDWHAAMHAREIDAVRATKRPVRGEVPFVGTLGRRDYDYIFVPVFGADGEVEAVAGTTRDVTDRKAAEEALRAAHGRSEAALQAGEVGTYYWDVAADRVTGDRNFAAIFGAVLGAGRPSAPVADFLAAIHPEDRDRVGAEIRRTLEGAAPFRSEYRLAGPAGERWLLARGAVRRGDGAAVDWNGVVVDITDRKRAEAALAASRARIDYAARASQIGFWYCDLPFDVLTWDERVKAHFWLPPDARVTIETFYARIHPDDRGPTRAAIERSVAGHSGYDVHYRTVDPATGAEKWVRALGGTDYDAAGTPKRFDGVTLDVTDQRRAEAAVRESNDRFRIVAKATNDAVWDWDLRTDAVWWNEGVTALFGHAPGAVGRDAAWWADQIHPDDRARVIAGIHAVIDHGGANWSDEYRFRRADGTYAAVLDRGYAIHEGGKSVRLVGAMQDVTARKRADAAVRFLADASATLAELVDYESTLGRIAGLAVGRFADWCVVDVLDAAGARKRLAVTGAPGAAGPPDSAADDLAVGIPHVLQTGEPTVVPDLAALDPATAALGAERLARLRAWDLHSYVAVPLVSRGKVIGGMTFLSASPDRRFGPTELGVATDLAGRVTTAIENAQLYRSLQEQDRRKDEFLATLAHELRNPLAPVRTGVQILRTVLPPDERTGRTLAMMDRQLGHMVHLVDDLMDVARVSSGKVVLRKDRVDLQTVVDAAVEATRQVVEAGGHELAVDLPPAPLEFDADKTRLVQVVTNLLNNAAKYTPHGGRIDIIARAADGVAVLRVADTGVGIAAEMLPKVFEMFTQVGTSLERSQGGLGIGLTLVKRLVEMHGGSVAAESPGPGRGSTFVVRLPLAAAVPAAGDRGPAAAGPAPARLSILVVDDNVDAAESLSLLLTMKGHEVRAAHDGPDALRVLGAYRPHLVVLDIGLPGMTGYEVARRIRESDAHRGAALAALTGWGQDEDRRRSREAGFDYHLTKPADAAEVERILGEVAGR